MADRFKSDNLKAEAKRAYAAAAQHRGYEEQTHSVNADQLEIAHRTLAEDYDALAIAREERAKDFESEEQP